MISGCVRDPRREKWMDGERYWRLLICIVGMVMVWGILGYHGLDHPRESHFLVLWYFFSEYQAKIGEPYGQ